MTNTVAKALTTRALRLLGVPFVLLAGVRCAHVEAPSGGPVDTVPPAVAAVFPAPGATGVAAESRAIFQFTEWVDRGAARGTVFISPPYAGRVRVEVDGDRLIVQPPSGQSLRPGTTHTVSVLGSLKDLRGNAMGRVFDLRFSTGPRLDSAGLDGALHREGRRGALLAALYPTGAMRTASTITALTPRDTAFSVAAAPEPWRELPAALAGSDSTGAFALTGAAPGTYGLFAFEDLNGNFAFDLGLEAAGVGEAALSLQPRAAAQTLRLAPLDTAVLRVLEIAFAADSLADDLADSIGRAARAAGLARGAVVVSFTRAPHPTRAAEAARYTLVPDSATAALGASELPVTAASWNLAREAWVLEAPPLRPGRWRLAVRARPDFPGRHGADGADTSVVFEVAAPSPEPATDAPAAPDSASAAAPAPAPEDADWTLTPLLPGSAPSGLPQTAPYLMPGARVLFASSLTLTPERWSRLVSRAEARVTGVSDKNGASKSPSPKTRPPQPAKTDTANAADSSVMVPHRLERVNASTLAVQLSSALRTGQTFALRQRPRTGDSAAPRVLYTGRVSDSTAAPVTYAPPAEYRDWTFWARAATLPANARPTFFLLRRGKGDSLTTVPVPPGRYLVHGLLDRDRDGVWNPGALRPWIAQEPYQVMKDTVVAGVRGDRE